MTDPNDKLRSLIEACEEDLLHMAYPHTPVTIRQEDLRQLLEAAKKTLEN